MVSDESNPEYRIKAGPDERRSGKRVIINPDLESDCPVSLLVGHVTLSPSRDNLVLDSPPKLSDIIGH